MTAMGVQSGEKTGSLAPKINRFVPTEIRGDMSRLSPGDKQALVKLVEAARLLDSIYIRQVWSGNAALLTKLRSDRSPLGKEKLHYFLMNMSPWSKIDHDEAFIEGVPVPRPPQADYYPDDMTKEEFNSWVAT